MYSEDILFTCNVSKYRGKDYLQEPRILVLSNNAIYNINLDDYNIEKRRIPLNSVTAISFAMWSNEFIIHVGDSYDYRFS